MPVKELQQFLDSNNVKYVTTTHSVAYTAQEVASLTHTKGRDLAKVVIVKLDDAMAMAVLPASHHVDMMLLQQGAGAKTVFMATEAEFRTRFPGCSTGAMPPFGNLYGMPVFVDETLTKDPEIAFNAGSHSELMRLSYKDFERLVQPKVIKFAAGKTATHAA